MKTKFAVALLCALMMSTAEADDYGEGGFDAATAARTARVISGAYANQTVQDVTQVYRMGSYLPAGAVPKVEMNIGTVQTQGYGGGRVENNVYVREATQVVLR